MGCRTSRAAPAPDVDAQGREPEESRLHGGRANKGSALARGGAPQEWSVQLVRQQGDVLGADLGRSPRGAAVLRILEGGLLDAWNRTQSSSPLRPGMVITEVNGATGYWNILDELVRPGALDMRVSAEPPPDHGPNWFQEVAELGQSLGERCSLEDRRSLEGCGSVMLRLQPQDQLSSVATVRAADCGVDQCAICIDDVGPDESLMQLPCRHAFHPLCAARWLTEGGTHSHGKRFCPLCCQKVACSAGGGIAAGRAEERKG